MINFAALYGMRQAVPWKKAKTEEIAVGKRQQVNRMENCEKQENNKKTKNK